MPYNGPKTEAVSTTSAVVSISYSAIVKMLPLIPVSSFVITVSFDTIEVSLTGCTVNKIVSGMQIEGIGVPLSQILITTTSSPLKFNEGEY